MNPESVRSHGTGSLGCVCPGSYDPITVGHLDIIQRARRLFGHVWVGVLDSASKRYMFSAAEREEMAAAATEGMPGVEVVRWDGLLIDLLDKLGANIVVRGVRGSGDMEPEAQMASVNRLLRPGTETVLLTAEASRQAVSSTVVRELIRFGADITAFVPPGVRQFLSNRAQDGGKG